MFSLTLLAQTGIESSCRDTTSGFQSEEAFTDQRALTIIECV